MVLAQPTLNKSFEIFGQSLDFPFKHSGHDPPQPSATEAKYVNNAKTENTN